MDQLSSAAIAAMAAKRRRVPARRPPFECIALLLQGGGALGSYQAGVYLRLRTNAQPVPLPRCDTRLGDKQGSRGHLVTARSPLPVVTMMFTGGQRSLTAAASFNPSIEPKSKPENRRYSANF
jgi:hypothetical protein